MKVSGLASGEKDFTDKLLQAHSLKAAMIVQMLLPKLFWQWWQ